MEINKVKELVASFKEAGLTSLSLKCDEFELKLKKEVTVALTSHADYIESQEDKDCKEKKVSGKAEEHVTPSEKVECAHESESESHHHKGDEKEDKSEAKTATKEVEPVAEKTINSPMVGTFYSASAPGAESFVKVGDRVKKGDVVCVIEAMKLMNEVEVEEDGEIVEILVNNEDMVEYGQALFVVK